MTLKLSILDLAPVVRGSSGPQALQNTLELARLADRLGYHRYWVAEHHNMAGVASSSPEILIAAIARETRHLRVGSGGIMLPNHSPLRVAENFRTLEALYPGRIDLGLGRAPGTDRRTALALRRNPQALAADDFPAQVAELQAYAGEGPFPEDRNFQGIQAYPADVALPPLYLLGSSTYGAEMAARLGLPYAFAYHFSPEALIPAMQIYHQAFQPSRVLQRPHAILTVAAICAEDRETAEELALPLDLLRIRLARGISQPFPTVEEAKAYPYTEQEQQIVQLYRKALVLGTPAQVREQLLDLSQMVQASEVMITSNMDRHRARLNSYRLIAEAFSLTAQA
ncbi:LLM class flavin-dependent oxidoreductase [Deinococcus cellulosilyticus]|uniref:Luciferase n=1 Tax=Deinococcus cellulosilyticus (strain DSM 18568 / NBRC 106333 / KACC 11606 / 5516J-15) TaxID=1223518 RepID=A0A511N1I3_DEIC1|nr:LLM class flavin-dependent oxidoreductase [Deinococcus cellulosilyticus]GEM46723.1 luciferase [Deinococcus cellulosilyticus NBRC 106333 = KACC 11606]